MSDNPKEVAVFKTYTKYNKLKVFGISMLIIIVVALALYFPIKTLFKYTITYHLNGGSVYNQEFVTQEYKFLQKITEPQGIKKYGVENGEEVGYYIDHYSKKEDLSDIYTFGGKMWSSFHLYVCWERGVAVRLHFAQGEENSEMSTADLKGYFEQYVKPGSTYTLPLVYNYLDEDGDHYGEQLLWYDNPECTGEPFETKTYENLTESIDIYGKWFDTDESKFEVDQDGTLIKYLGYCNKIILPDNIKKIKDIEYSNFKSGYSDMLGDQDGTYYSVWANLMGGNTNSTSTAYKLNTVYINEGLTHIGDCAFRGCKSLERIVFKGNNVESIGEGAFEGCESLKVFSMPSKVKIIKKNTFFEAFAKRSNLNLDMSNIERIEDNAFANSKVKGVILSNVTFIGKNAFSACGELETFKLMCETPPTSNVDVSDNTEFTNGQAIFYSTYTTSSSNILKIIVPEGSIDEYIKYDCWAMYQNIITDVEN